MKARFDYGVTIFILTFSLVSVSGYRVEKLIDMAHQRLATIIIGTALCMVTAMVVYPIWAGEELHFLIIRNMDKVSDSLDGKFILIIITISSTYVRDYNFQSRVLIFSPSCSTGCVTDYFEANEANSNTDDACSKNLEAYKSVLNSKGSEDAMVRVKSSLHFLRGLLLLMFLCQHRYIFLCLQANFARWEPAHGLFSFNHPWQKYLKVSAALRNCAYCIEALNSCLYSENKSPDFVKNHLSDTCSSVSSNSCEIIKELALTIKTMTRSIRRLRLMCFEKVIHMEISWFDKLENSSGAIGARLSADASAVRGIVGDALGYLVQISATAIAGLVIGFQASWQLSIVLLFMLPLVGLNGYFQIKSFVGFHADSKVAME